jgi:ABC-type phosphate transport system substrate-binding protein
MKLCHMVLSLTLLLIVVCLAGCGAAAAPADTSAPKAYADPFAYCAAVGTIDAPDASFTGPAVPE